MFLSRVSMKLLFATIILSFSGFCRAQEHVFGIIYDHADGTPLRGASVSSLAGKITITDSLGRYSIILDKTDSFYCSWLGVQTMRFAVQDIPQDKPFNLSLDTKNSKTLPSYSLTGASYDYERDSMRNRAEYQKEFEFEKKEGAVNGLKAKQRGGIGVGFDLTQMADPKAANRKEALHDRLQQDEEDRYIDYRFTKPLAERLTHIHPPFLDQFMKLYRPTYQDLRKYENDYEFYQSVSLSGKAFNAMVFNRYCGEMLLDSSHLL